MFVHVNGAKLYFDVEGAGLVPDGPSMRAKPTLVLLHGGPGADHTIFKPAFSALADIAQIIYFDQRDCGRSDECDPETWNLAQWGDDVKGSASRSRLSTVCHSAASWRRPTRRAILIIQPSSF